MNNIKIRDLRSKSQYKIDDEYLNGYAKLCGIYATAVYNSLSRHADFYQQKCFPSISLIAEQHNISKPTVLRAIKVLEVAGIVIRERVGKMQPNIYILSDKSTWVKKDDLEKIIGIKNKRGISNNRQKNGKFGSEVNDMAITSEVNITAECSKSYGQSEVNDVECKDNTVKDTNNKDNKYKKLYFYRSYIENIDPSEVKDLSEKYNASQQKILDEVQEMIKWLDGYGAKPRNYKSAFELRLQKKYGLRKPNNLDLKKYKTDEEIYGTVDNSKTKVN